MHQGMLVKQVSTPPGASVGAGHSELNQQRIDAWHIQLEARRAGRRLCIVTTAQRQKMEGRLQWLRCQYSQLPTGKASRSIDRQVKNVMQPYQDETALVAATAWSPAIIADLDSKQEDDGDDCYSWPMQGLCPMLATQGVKVDLLQDVPGNKSGSLISTSQVARQPTTAAKQASCAKDVPVGNSGVEAAGQSAHTVSPSLKVPSTSSTTAAVPQVSNLGSVQTSLYACRCVNPMPENKSNNTESQVQKPAATSSSTPTTSSKATKKTSAAARQGSKENKVQQGRSGTQAAVSSMHKAPQTPHLSSEGTHSSAKAQTQKQTHATTSAGSKQTPVKECKNPPAAKPASASFAGRRVSAAAGVPVSNTLTGKSADQQRTATSAVTAPNKPQVATHSAKTLQAPGKPTSPGNPAPAAATAGNVRKADSGPAARSANTSKHESRYASQKESATPAGRAAMTEKVRPDKQASSNTNKSANSTRKPSCKLSPSAPVGQSTTASNQSTKTTNRQKSVTSAASPTAQKADAKRSPLSSPPARPLAQAPIKTFKAPKRQTVAPAVTSRSTPTGVLSPCSSFSTRSVSSLASSQELCAAPLKLACEKTRPVCVASVTAAEAKVAWRIKVDSLLDDVTQQLEAFQAATSREEGFQPKTALQRPSASLDG